MAWQNPNLTANKTEERRAKDASNFQKMVQMLGMARQTDGQTMLGFALGHFLKDWWNRRLAKEREDGAGATLNDDDPNASAAKKALQQANAMQFFGMQTPQQAWESQLYGGGKSWQQRMSDDFTRMALDPDYNAKMQARYGQPKAGTSSLQDYITQNGYGGGRSVQENAAQSLLPISMEKSASKETTQVATPEGTATFTFQKGDLPTAKGTDTSGWDTSLKTSGKPSALQMFIDADKNYNDLLNRGYNNLFGR